MVNIALKEEQDKSPVIILEVNDIPEPGDILYRYSWINFSMNGISDETTECLGDSRAIRIREELNETTKYENEQLKTFTFEFVTSTFA